MQWHSITILILIHFLTLYYDILTLFKQILTLPRQAVQLAYIMEDKLKDATEEVDKERDMKYVVDATIKEKATATESAEAWA